MKPAEVERLYGQFGHSVYLRAFYLLREEQAAMDIVQDVFEAAMHRLLPFPDDRRAGAWLLRVATNKSLNELRRHRYWRTRPMEEHPAARAENPFPFLEDRLLFDQLLVALDDRKAGIVVSYFLEGKTLNESAAAARVSVPTVRRTLSAFIEQAKARLGQGGGA